MAEQTGRRDEVLGHGQEVRCPITVSSREPATGPVLRDVRGSWPTDRALGRGYALYGRL